VVNLTDNPGGTVNLDLATGNKFYLLMTGTSNTRTLTVSNPTTRVPFTLELEQSATGGNAVTFFGTLRTPGGAAPAVTTTASKVDVFTFSPRGGGVYLGMSAGANL
jgi:hypothetical protein